MAPLHALKKTFPLSFNLLLQQVPLLLFFSQQRIPGGSEAELESPADEGGRSPQRWSQGKYLSVLRQQRKPWNQEKSE